MFLFEGAIKYLKRKYVIKCIFSFKDFDKSCLLFQTIIPSTFLKKVFHKVIPFYYILKTILNTFWLWSQSRPYCCHFISRTSESFEVKASFRYASNNTLCKKFVSPWIRCYRMLKKKWIWNAGRMRNVKRKAIYEIHN